MGKSHVLLFHLCQMRSQNHTPGVTRPMTNIKARVIFRQKWITCVSKNRLNKIKITDQITWSKKTSLHRFSAYTSGTSGLITGRNIRETNAFTGSFSSLVKGTTMRSSGEFNATFNIAANVCLRTASLSAAIGKHLQPRGTPP